MTRTVDSDAARRLVGEGAQLVDVLPAETFAQEHLPGAINIPLAEIDSARERLDPAFPIVVYCYDYQCDLSPRGAARLEQLGFENVYDYATSKVAWLAEGWSGEGLLRDRERVGSITRTDVPRVGARSTLRDLRSIIDDWEVVVVVTADDVVVGVVRSEAIGVDGAASADVSVEAVMQTAPPTVRPSISIRELAKSMDDDGQLHVLVTTLHGTLIGLVRRSDLDVA